MTTSEPKSGSTRHADNENSPSQTTASGEGRHSEREAIAQELYREMELREKRNIPRMSIEEAVERLGRTSRWAPELLRSVIDEFTGKWWHKREGRDRHGRLGLLLVRMPRHGRFGGAA